MRKIERDIRQRFPGSTISTSGRNHYRVDLPGGGIVIISSTPSRQRFWKNAERDARYSAKQHRAGRSPATAEE